MQRSRKLNVNFINSMETEQTQGIQTPPIAGKNGKKLYIYIGVGVLAAILIAAGIYWYAQKEQIVPILEDLAIDNEEEALNQDLLDLELFAGDNSLEGLDNDLTRVAGENIVVETASAEKMESEFSEELSGLSSDLADLEGIGNDTSLDTLESGLSNI